MKTNQQEEMEKEFKHITETAMKGWSFSPFITEQLKPYTKDLFDKTYTLQQEKIEKLEKDNDLKDSWIKHHQKTVEIQLEKVAELNKQIEILRFRAYS